MPGNEFEGQITSVFPAADPKSRVFNVEVTIPNPKALLRPGMIVSLRVGRSEAVQAQPVVPLNAIVKSTTGCACTASERPTQSRSEEHTSELQSPDHLVCPLLL